MINDTDLRQEMEGALNDAIKKDPSNPRNVRIFGKRDNRVRDRINQDLEEIARRNRTDRVLKGTASDYYPSSSLRKRSYQKEVIKSQILLIFREEADCL